MNRAPALAPLALLAALAVAACASTGVRDRVAAPIGVEARSACLAVLSAQQRAWNRGDIPAFVRGYHRSPNVVFASTGGVSLGADKLEARYRKRYPDRASMGKLSFSRLTLSPLRRDHIVVRGHWHLARAAPHGALAGRFLLVMRRIDKVGWRVVLDYTLLDTPTKKAK